MIFLFAFTVGFALDVFYAKYVMACAGKRAFTAAINSVLIGACGVAGVLSILLHGQLSLAGYLLGLGVGTYYGVKSG